MKNNYFYEYLTSIDPDALSLVYYEHMDENSNLWNLEKHDHDYMEVLFFIEGNLNIDSASERIKATTYSIIIYPPHVFHQEYLLPNHRQNVITLGIKIRSHLKIDCSFKLSDTDGLYRWLFEQISCEMQKKKFGYEELCHSYLKVLFQHLRRSFYYYSEPSSKDIYESVLDYFEANYQNPVSIQGIAKMLYVSPSYLYRNFKQHTGKSPNQYLTELRIEKARLLLTQTNYTVEKISELTGYQDVSYFSRIFRKITGITPSSCKQLL